MGRQNFGALTIIMVSRILILSAAVFLVAQAFSIDPFKIDKVPFSLSLSFHLKLFLSDGSDTRRLTTRLTLPTRRRRDAMLSGRTTPSSSCKTKRQEIQNDKKTDKKALCYLEEQQSTPCSSYNIFMIYASILISYS